MAENSTDLEANAARLAAEVQEATSNNKRSGGSDKSRTLVAALLFGVATIAVVAFFYGGESGPTSTVPAAARPDDFQTAEGSPFGTLMRPTPERIVEVDTSENDLLRGQLAALQDELERLKNTPADTPKAESPDAALEARLATMQEEMDLLAMALDGAEEERQRALDAKDRELLKMQAALDAASLQGGGIEPSLDAAEARRREAQEIYARRAGSAMIAFGGSSSGAADGALGMAGEALGGQSVEGRKMSANERYAREAGAPAQVEQAKIIVNPSNTVIQGTMIQASLETFINSDLPGQIRAVVGEDVHSYDGAQILIPRGSKVIGQYSDEVEMGQRRAMVVWTRIIMPDNQTVSISSIGGDAIGQSGLAGRVNTHFGSRFGSAALISLITIAPTLALSDDDSNRSRDTADAMSQSMSSATANSLDAALSRKPTITIAQGARVTIMVDRDLEIF